MQLRAAVLVALLLLACEEPGPPGEATARVERYDLAVDLRTGAARSTLTLAVEAPLESSCFTVPSDLPLSLAVVTGADDARATPVAGGLTVCGALEESRTLRLQSSFVLPEQTQPGTNIGFSRTTDRTGRPFTYLLSWVGRCTALGPCDPSPAALTHFTFDLAHAPDEVALCPGVRTVSRGQTRCELLGTRAPTYSAFAAASNPGWARTQLSEGGGVSLVLHEVPEGTLRSDLDGSATADFLAWITSLLGPFPYGPELRLATGPTRWLGMEHPANIVLMEDYASLPPVYADVPLHAVLHEIVHQWAGNRTTLAATRDFVWKEALAEYLAYLFEEQRSTAAAAQTRTTWHRQAISAPTYPVPTDAEEPSLEVISAGAYGTGPMLLFLQLEPLLGRDGVLAGIQRFLAEPGARSTEELRDALEASSGAELGAYFDAWVFGTGEPAWPTFVADVASAGGTASVTLTQTGGRAGVVYPCVVEVELRGATQTSRAIVPFPLGGTSSVATASVSFAEPVTGFTVDPDRRVVDLPVLGVRPARATTPEVRWHP